MFSFENCVQVRGLLEQAEEMVESEDLMEEEFNQVMFGFFRNEKEIMIMVMVMMMMVMITVMVMMMMLLMSMVMGGLTFQPQDRVHPAGGVCRQGVYAQEDQRCQSGEEQTTQQRSQFW